MFDTDPTDGNSPQAKRHPWQSALPLSDPTHSALSGEIRSGVAGGLLEFVGWLLVLAGVGCLTWAALVKLGTVGAGELLALPFFAYAAADLIVAALLIWLAGLIAPAKCRTASSTSSR